MIIEELSRIQRELHAPKNLFNKFGNYNYRNAEGILEAVKPLLNGLALVINDKPVLIGERYYIEATATLTNGNESISATAYAREDEQKKGMDGCQITGACSSYARKYALNALLMIDDSKDSDDDSMSPKNPENVEKEDIRPIKRDAPAKVDVSNKLPETAKPTTVQKGSKKPETDAVMQYLIDSMRELRELRNINPTENNKLFKKQREVLIEKGLAPNKGLDEYTQEEAEALIGMMHGCFELTGTELKVE